MMTKNTKTTAHHMGQDLSLMGFRFVALLAVVTVLFFNSQRTGIPAQGNLLQLGGVALGINLLLFLVLLIPQLSEAKWLILLGDWTAIGALTWMARGDVGATTLLIAALPLVSMLRLGIVGGLVNVFVSLVLFFGILTYFSGNELATYIGPMVLPMVLVGTVGGAMAFMLWNTRRQFETQHKDILQDARKADERVANMQKRTRAITDMSHLLSSTLNYQRVLDAALGMGSLALNDETMAFSSLVMLYRPEDRMLYLATGRGVARPDRQMVTAGREGLLAECLTTGDPMFSNDVRKDPELRRFATFQRAQSIVCVPLRAGYDNYGVVMFASQRKNAFNELYKDFLQAIGIQATIALQNASLYQDLADEKEHLLEVEEEARKKLARDLHDGPTQTIAAIAMRMTIIQKMLQVQPDEVPDELKKIEDLARKTTSEIRHMMFTLRPLALESQGLEAALEQLADKFQTVYSQRVVIKVGHDVEAVLTTHQSGTIFYLIEEAVNNARKHAQSEVIRASVQRFEDQVMVEISDNGVGFDVEAVGDNYEGRTSLGMVNLHERTELIDGHLTIDSAPGKGTRITIVAPLDPAGTNERFQNPQPKRRKKGFQLSAIR